MFILVYITCFVANLCLIRCDQNITVRVVVHDNNPCKVTPTFSVTKGEKINFIYDYERGARSEIQYVEYESSILRRKKVFKHDSNKAVILGNFNPGADSNWTFAFYYNPNKKDKFKVDVDNRTFSRAQCSTKLIINMTKTTTTTISSLPTSSTTPANMTFDVQSTTPAPEPFDEQTLFLWLIIGSVVLIILIGQAIAIIYYRRRALKRSGIETLGRNENRNMDTDRYSSPPGRTHRSSSKDLNGERESAIYETVNIDFAGQGAPPTPNLEQQNTKPIHPSWFKRTIDKISPRATPISQRAQMPLPVEEDNIYEAEPVCEDIYEPPPIVERPPVIPPMPVIPIFSKPMNPNFPMPKNPIATLPNKQSFLPPKIPKHPHVVNTQTIPSYMKGKNHVAPQPMNPNVPLPKAIQHSINPIAPFPNNRNPHSMNSNLPKSITQNVPKPNIPISISPKVDRALKPSVPIPNSPKIPHSIKQNIPHSINQSIAHSMNQNIPHSINQNIPHSMNQNVPIPINVLPPNNWNIRSPKPIPKSGYSRQAEEGRPVPRPVFTPKRTNPSTNLPGNGSINTELEGILSRNRNGPPPVMKKPVPAVEESEPSYDSYDSSDSEWNYEPLNPIHVYD